MGLYELDISPKLTAKLEGISGRKYDINHNYTPRALLCNKCYFTAENQLFK